jgi:hypothetical protein
MAPTAEGARRTRAAGDRAAVLVALLATVALALGLVGPVGALAQEDDEEDTIALEVEREAYWTNSAADALPPILVSEFPPGVICIVAPEFCAGLDDLQEQLSDATGQDVDLDAVREELLEAARDVHSPIQPVQPETLPTGRLGGVPRFGAALVFDLPPTPEGQEIVRFELIFQEAQPTYAVDSPAFRQAVLAALVGVQEQHPEPAIEQFLRIVEDPETYPPADDAVMELEACPTTEDWEEGDNQEWDERPGIDCILGSTGTRADDGTWRFDLTFAAQVWDDGALTNTGVFLGPLSAANLAFGDPDTSDNAQVSLAGGDSELGAPVAIIEYAEAMEPFDFGDGPPTQGEFDAEPMTAEPTNGDVFGQMDADHFDQPAEAAEPTPETAEAPEVADEEAQPQAVAAQQAQPTTPWYAWLALLAGMAGLVALSQALAADPALAAERKGAMSRLIEQRAAAGGPDQTTKV